MNSVRSVPQDCYLDVLGDLRDDGRVQVHTSFMHQNAKWCSLVNDAVEAYPIGEAILLMVLVVQHVGLIGVEMCIEAAKKPRVEPL